MFDTAPCNGPFESLDVAAFAARTCIRERIPYTTTKMQKLLYCVYGVVLAQFDRQICREVPHAWPYGPVFPRVFFHMHEGHSVDEYPTRLQRELSPEEQALVARIVRFFGRYSADRLSCWSRLPGSPWERAVREKGAGWTTTLRNADIADYFRRHVLA